MPTDNMAVRGKRLEDAQRILETGSQHCDLVAIDLERDVKASKVMITQANTS